MLLYTRFIYTFQLYITHISHEIFKSSYMINILLYRGQRGSFIKDVKQISNPLSRSNALSMMYFCHKMIYPLSLSLNGVIYVTEGSDYRLTWWLSLGRFVAKSS